MPLISATGEAEGGAETFLHLDKASSGSSTTKTSVFGDAIPTETSESAAYRWQQGCPTGWRPSTLLNSSCFCRSWRGRA